MDPGSDKPSPPEVEAELVEPSEPLRDHPTPPPMTEPDTKQPIPVSRPIRIARIAAMALGVTIIVAAGVLLLPRVLPGGRDGAEKEQQPAPVAAQSEPGAEESDDPPAPGPAKIANTAGDAKAAAEALGPPSLPPGRGLPPPPPATAAEANEAMRAAAKDALKSLPPPATDPATEEAPAIEFKTPPSAEEQSAIASDAALAELEAQAEAEAAAQAQGLAAAPVAPTTSAPLASANDFAAAASIYEAERLRLTADLGAERARVAEQAKEIEQLRAQLEESSRQNASEISFASASVALPALARAVDLGRPFEAELAGVAKTDKNLAAWDALEKISQAGAPTLSRLQTDFPPAAREALAAAARAESPGLFGGLAAGMARLVSIRPAGPRAGAYPGAILSRVEARLANGDLEGAIAEAEGLRGPARPPLQVWIEEARKLAAAHAALSEIGATTSAALASPAAITSPDSP